MSLLFLTSTLLSRCVCFCVSIIWHHCLAARVLFMLRSTMAAKLCLPGRHVKTVDGAAGDRGQGFRGLGARRLTPPMNTGTRLSRPRRAQTLYNSCCQNNNWFSHSQTSMYVFVGFWRWLVSKEVDAWIRAIVWPEAIISREILLYS